MKIWRKLYLQKKYYTFIDVARGLGNIFIVIGHVFKIDALRGYLYSFHVPMFFFLSKLTYTNKSDKKEFWKKKVKSVLIPYFFAGLLSIIALALLGNFASDRLGSEIGTMVICPIFFLPWSIGRTRTGRIKK